MVPGAFPVVPGAFLTIVCSTSPPWHLLRVSPLCPFETWGETRFEAIALVKRTVTSLTPGRHMGDGHLSCLQADVSSERAVLFIHSFPLVLAVKCLWS